MKKIYLFAVAAMTAFSMVASHPTFKLAKHRSPAIKSEVKHRANTENAVWRAGTQIIAVWTGTEWEDSEKYTTRYDAEGRIVEDINASLYPDDPSAAKTTNSYNENGQLALKIVETSEDGVTFENSEKTERKYDERLVSLITDNAEYFWMNGSWANAGNTYRRYVTRNADGNVTRVVVAVLYEGEYDPTEMLDIEYGPDKKATKITSSSLTTDDGLEFYWVVGEVYSDIVWERTDGQIVSTDELFTLSNGIKSCVYSDGDVEGQTISAEYTDEKGSYKIVSDAVFDGEKAHMESVYKVVDDLGSYTITQAETYGEGDMAESYVATERYYVDEYGLETEVYASESMDGGPEEILQWMKGAVTYDSDFGYPLEYVISEYDFDMEEFSDVMRVKFSDYVDAAGVQAIGVDAADGPVEVFNLQGVRVDPATAAPGLYIRRQGGKITKVVVK